MEADKAKMMSRLGRTCAKCCHEDMEHDAFPCVDCARGDGSEDKWEPKEELLDKINVRIMDDVDWAGFMNGRLAVDLRGRKEPSPIKDSGERRQFATGAVRDIAEGKGRCDLLPLDVVASWMNDVVLVEIASFTQTHNILYLMQALDLICDKHYSSKADMMLEAATRFEEGLKKYPAHNWENGIPVHSFIDSGVRHYLRALRGDDDEPHMNACVWNLLCCIWTMIHKPECDDLPKKEGSDASVSQ